MSGARKKKAEMPQAEARTDDVLRLRLAGNDRSRVRAYVRLREQQPGNPWTLNPGEEPMSRAMVFKYIARADAVMAEQTEKRRGRARAQHIAMRRDLYRRRYEAGDDETALEILKDEAKLRDLYPPKKVARTDPSGKHAAPGFLGESADAFVAGAIGMFARIADGPGGTAQAGASEDDAGPAGDGPASLFGESAAD